MPETTNTITPRTIPGKWVVLGLFLFGGLAVSVIWIYAVVELGPFEPLARAIKSEFPTSRPHVKGGRPRNKPPLLRIVMEVDFTPREDDVRIATIQRRVIELSQRHLPLQDYEDFELHIVHYVPEAPPEQLVFARKVTELAP